MLGLVESQIRATAVYIVSLCKLHSGPLSGQAQPYSTQLEKQTEQQRKETPLSGVFIFAPAYSASLMERQDSCLFSPLELCKLCQMWWP